jgi:hypothetical protein
MYRRQHRGRFVAQVAAVALALGVALVFTPCCELSAAVRGADVDSTRTDARPEPVGDPHAPTHDHAPASDQWCGTALDKIVTPPADLAPPAQTDSGAASYVPQRHPLPPAVSSTTHRLVTRLGASGPPLYLRFAHLLI